MSADPAATATAPHAALGASTPQRAAGEPEATFVVGIARSATTLLRSQLETADRIAIARESHFMARPLLLGRAMAAVGYTR